MSKTKLDTRATRTNLLTSREVVSILGAQVGGLISGGLAGEEEVITALRWLGENAEKFPAALRGMAELSRSF